MNKDKKELLSGILTKAAEVKKLDADKSEMTKINNLTLEALDAEDVFVFKIAICDNEVDRQHERFSIKSMHDMAELFIGKPLIKDHVRTSDNQIGRIYDTEVLTEKDVLTEADELYTQLVAHCYVLKTDSNQDLIADIKGGIKKEVSVNAAVSKYTCSICGKDNGVEMCDHFWGREYDGQKCYFILDDPVDAFEVSFVAVPAQKLAGTIKSLDEEKDKELSKSNETEIDLLSVMIGTTEAFVYLEKEKGDKENE